MEGANEGFACSDFEVWVPDGYRSIWTIVRLALMHISKTFNI